MSSAFAIMRSVLFRPWVMATMAAVLTAVVLLLASGWFAAHQAREAEIMQMDAQGQRFKERLEQLFGQLREGIDRLEVQPLRGCDGQMVELLRSIGFDYRFIYDAAYVDDHQSCSTRTGHHPVASIRAPDIKGPVYSYWLNTTLEPDDNLAALMLGRGHFRVSTSRGHLTDVVDLSPGSSLMVVLDQGQRAIPVLGPAQPWIGSASDDERLQVTRDRLIYRMRDPASDYQMVLVTPRSGQSFLASPTVWIFIAGSLLVAACVGWLVLQLMRQRLSLSAELQGALRRGEIKVMFQPIFHLGSRQCVGAEALVRWRRPDGTLTSPDLFIPLAEDTGQIRAITDFVLEQVLEQLGRLLRANPHLYISVNLAACDVMVPRIQDVAARLLAAHHVSPRQIAFEVTERGLIDVVVARDNLQALRDVGHPVLIDDFGTGYCSLAYLQTLPVDCLKIDKAFIDALGHDAASSGVAPHIIRMAHALSLRVIAEGIEYEAQADLLDSEGVAYGQGWLFAQPLNAKQFSELVTRDRRERVTDLD